MQTFWKGLFYVVKGFFDEIYGMIFWWRKKKNDEENYTNRQAVIIRAEDLDGLTPQEMLDLVRAIERGEDIKLGRRRVEESLYIGDVYDSLGNYLGSYLHPKSEITHVAIFGSTGMGKSTLLLMMARHLMLTGEGVTIFDPHGELARDVLSLVPSRRVNDVIFIDPAFFESVGKVIRINPLEYDARDPSSRERAAQDFMTPLRKLYADFWGPRLERILYHAMKLLLSFPPGEVQLIDLYDLIMNQKRREELIHAAKEYGLDPATEKFWSFEFQGYKEEAVQAVLTKITQLLSNTYASMVFNTETGFSDIDFHEVLNKRKILIVSTPIGILRELPAQFISSFIITRYFLASMERINVAGEKAESYPDHWVIIDEAHIAESQALIDIMTQARKYKLHIILATQYPSQFSREVKSAILNNASIIITFKNGPEASDDLATVFQLRRNEWEEKKLEIMNLPSYTFIAKFQNNPLPKTLMTNNIKSSLKDQMQEWRTIADNSMNLYAKELHREYYYMPLLSREAIIMLGQYLLLSGLIIPPRYLIDKTNFLRYVELKLQQENIQAKSDDALLELRTHEILIPKENTIIPGKMLKQYLDTIEQTPPIAKPTILKHIFNSYIYIPQKTPNLLTPDIIIDKHGRRKTGAKEENTEKTLYIYITPTPEDREKIEKQKTRFRKEGKNTEVIILDTSEDQPYETKEKTKNIEKELTALTLIFKNALKDPLDEETLIKELAHHISILPTTLTPTLETNETQAILNTLQNSGMIKTIELKIFDKTTNIIIPTEEAIKEYFTFTPSPKTALKTEQAYLIQKTMHLIYTDELKITKTPTYLQPHKHEPYTSAPDITVYILTQQGYQPFYAIEIETQHEQNNTQILINYYKNTARNQKVIFITDTQEKAQKIKEILKTEGIPLPAIITLPPTPHDQTLKTIYQELETPERNIQKIQEQLTNYYMSIIYQTLKNKQNNLIRTTIITTLENLYNTIKNPTETTKQLHNTIIELLNNTQNLQPLTQLKIQYTTTNPEQAYQQILQTIKNTIEQTQEGGKQTPIIEEKPPTQAEKPEKTKEEKTEEKPQTTKEEKEPSKEEASEKKETKETIKTEKPEKTEQPIIQKVEPSKEEKPEEIEEETETTIKTIEPEAGQIITQEEVEETKIPETKKEVIEGQKEEKKQREEEKKESLEETEKKKITEEKEEKKTSEKEGKMEKELEGDVGKFIKNMCIIDENTRIEKGKLYEAYTEWAMRNKKKPLGRNQFYNIILEHFEEKKIKGVNYFKGLTLREDVQ